MSLVHVLAASKMEGQPVLQIAGTGADKSPTRPPQSLRPSPNEIVLTFGGMLPLSFAS